MHKNNSKNIYLGIPKMEVPEYMFSITLTGFLVFFKTEFLLLDTYQIIHYFQNQYHKMKKVYISKK